MITIVTPTYNSSKFLVEQYERLKSILSPNITWYIIDDCSKDNTESVVNDFDCQYIRYLRLSSNQGPANARLAGVSVAATELVFFLDVDDVVYCEYFMQFMQFISNHKNYDFYYCPIFSSTTIESKHEFKREEVNEISKPTDFITYGFPHPSSLVVNKDFYIKNVPSNSLEWGEDILLYLHMSKNGTGIRWWLPVSCYYLNGGRGSLLSIKKRMMLIKELLCCSLSGSKKVNSLIFSVYMSIRYCISYLYKRFFAKKYN